MRPFVAVCVRRLDADVLGPSNSLDVLGRYYLHVLGPVSTCSRSCLVSASQDMTCDMTCLMAHDDVMITRRD